MPHHVLAYFLGGPCDGRGVYIGYDGPPPATLHCKGVTYQYMPNSRGALTYATSDYAQQYDHAKAARLSRDVTRAWTAMLHGFGNGQHRLTRNLAHASQRLRRAVR